MKNKYLRFEISKNIWKVDYVFLEIENILKYKFVEMTKIRSCIYEK